MKGVLSLGSTRTRTRQQRKGIQKIQWISLSHFLTNIKTASWCFSPGKVLAFTVWNLSNAQIAYSIWYLPCFHLQGFRDRRCHSSLAQGIPLPALEWTSVNLNSQAKNLEHNNGQLWQLLTHRSFHQIFTPKAQVEASQVCCGSSLFFPTSWRSL